MLESPEVTAPDVADVFIYLFTGPRKFSIQYLHGKSPVSFSVTLFSFSNLSSARIGNKRIGVFYFRGSVIIYSHDHMTQCEIGTTEIHFVGTCK